MFSVSCLTWHWPIVDENSISMDTLSAGVATCIGREPTLHECWTACDSHNLCQLQGNTKEEMLSEKQETAAI
jgi:hypothetical protein